MKILRYLFNSWWKTVKRGKPNKRAFLIFLKMLRTEIKCILLTGYTTEEISDKYDFND